MIGPLLRLSHMLYFPRFAQFIMMMVLSGLLVSCGLKRQGDGLQLPPAAMIQDVRVTEGSEKTIVEVEAEEPMIYTTFRLSDPDRLVIDMAEVDLSRFSNEIQVESGPIRAIRPASGGGSNVSRLEFELSGVVETDVRTEGLNLVVEVTQIAATPQGFRFFEDEGPLEPLTDGSEIAESDTIEMTAEVAPPLEAPAEIMPGLPKPEILDTPEVAIEVSEASQGEDIEVSTGDAALSQKAEASQTEISEIKEGVPDALPGSSLLVEKENPLPPAQNVSGLRFEPGNVLKLIVSSDGVLSPRTFFIGSGDKRRLVIDLPGVKILSKQTRVAVDDHRVKQVRVGQHKKKVRLVLDLRGPISYDLSQHRGELEILVQGPSKKENSDTAKDESVLPEAVLATEQSPEVGLEKTDPEMAAAGVGRSAGSDAAMKLAGLALPIPSASVAAAATLPPPLPVPDAESDDDSKQSSQLEEVPQEEVAQEEAPQIEVAPEVPQVEVTPESVESEAVSEGDAAMEAEPSVPGLQKAGEGPEMEKMAPASVLESSTPSKAEVTLSPAESSPAPLPLPDVEAESLVSEDENKALVEEETAKKKVILRRKRREAAALKREAVALVDAQGAEEAQPSAASKYTGRKISLDFQDAEITNVVRLLADVSGLNFVIGDDVKGKITLKMNDVPWDQALDIILEIRNLGMEQEGGIIRITTLANLVKQRNEQADARETKVRSEELLTRVVYINYAKAEKMKNLLLKLLSSRGEIMVASRVNALVIKDIVGSIEQVEQMAKRLDTKTPQVLIEARIVEVQPTFKRSLGVQWGADFKTNSGGNSIGIGNFSGTGSGVFNPVQDFSVNVPAAAPLGGVGFSFGRFTESPFQLDLRISAGESQEMTRIVSTPKIMVLDNNEALIKQGAQIPFQSSSANGGTNTQLVDASLQLKVIPHISQDGGILLELNLTKNEPGPPVQGSTQPAIFEKEVVTQILLMDGETMVIGGIYETKKTESEGGIPYLKDIPGLGWLFKNKEKNESTTELLIFITPTVMS